MNNFILSLFVLFFGACFNTNLNCKSKMMEPEGAAAAADTKPLLSRIKSAITLYNTNYPDRVVDLDWYKAFLRTKLGVEVTDDVETSLDTVFRKHYGEVVDLNTFIRICDLDDIIAFLVLFYSTNMKVMLQRLILSYEKGILSKGHNAEPYKFIFLKKAEAIFAFLVKRGVIAGILDSSKVSNALENVKLDSKSVVDICISNPVEIILEIMPGVTLRQLKSIKDQIDEINASTVSEDKKQRSINELIFFLHEHDRSAVLNFLREIGNIENVLYMHGMTYSINCASGDVTYKVNETHLTKIASSATPRKVLALQQLDTEVQLASALKSKKVNLIQQLLKMQEEITVLESDLKKMLNSDYTVVSIEEHVAKNVLHGSILEEHHSALEKYLVDPAQVKAFVMLYNNYKGIRILISDNNAALERLNRLEF